MAQHPGLPAGGDGQDTPLHGGGPQVGQGLAVTKLDVLDSFSEIPVCVRYRLDGEPHDSMPAEVELLARVEPTYEALPGWQKSLSQVRRLADLPPAARAYLDRLQDLAHAPIRYVSVGTHRDQIIEVT